MEGASTDAINRVRTRALPAYSIKKILQNPLFCRIYINTDKMEKAMATAELNPAFMNFKGNIGRLIYYSRMGKTCVRSHVIPRNPRTEAQQKNRDLFAEAVNSWKLLTAEEKNLWKLKAAMKKRTGYNFFISSFILNAAKETDLTSTVSLLPAVSYIAPIPLRILSDSSPLRIAYSSGKAALNRKAGFI
jgi:hypothetical protein